MPDVEFLSQVPIFANLEPEWLKPLTGKLRPRRYRRGEVIFHEDEPGDRMHIIVEGSVKISVTSEDGREKNIALFKPGECFGEMALLDGSNRSATATAMEALETLVLMRDDFQDFLNENPQMKEDITNLLTQRLRNVNQQGNRVLTKEHLEEVVLDPTGFKPFTLDTPFEGGFLLQHIEGNLA